MSSQNSTDFDLNLLSPREKEVISGLMEGFTDEQIARSMAISTATVNSYWVRIRAKVGPYSRTEIATQFLRREMAERCAVLESEIARLRERESAVRAGESRVEASLERSGDEAWRFLALAHVMDATLVVAKTGAILYANPHARHLLRAERHELESLPFWELTRSENGRSCEEGVREFFENQEVRRTLVGLNVPYYARRRDGTEIRVTIAAEWFDSPEGVIAAVLLRQYTEDSARLSRSVHQPFTLT